MGNLTRDPELRFTNGGLAVCKVGLAINRKTKDGDSGNYKEEVTFVDVTIFGKRGEAFQKFHTKGAVAFIDGELRLDQWEDKDSGQKRSKLYVVANNWEFVNGGKEDRGSSTSDSGGGYGDQGGYGAPAEGFVGADDTPF
jgi:single-strand DNA-binding protein